MKPVALLERIIQASSNEGDVVLDPFCGCRSDIAEAQKLGRTWIGIGVTHLSVGLMKLRLKDSFGSFQCRSLRVSKGLTRKLEVKPLLTRRLPHAEPPSRERRSPRLQAFV